MNLRGVILAGGKGTRLGDLTRVTNKHLLPVGEWPMIYHPLRKLIEVGATEILLVSGPKDVGSFAELLGSGGRLGCDLTYRVQEQAGGIAQALSLAERFCQGASHCLVILGDNMFAESLQDFVCATAAKPQDAWVLLKRVPDPERYGVAQVRLGCITDLAEKPPNPKSDLAVTGIYLYPVDVFSMIRQIRASGRGEWEITDVNRGYMQEKRLSYCELKGFWIDAGTPQALSAASHFMLPTPPPKIGLKSTG